MARFTKEDDALLAELGVQVEPKNLANLTPREERIISGFEEIQQFVEKHGHAPRRGEELDIFERLYTVRLDNIRKQEEYRELLIPFDHQNLLAGPLINPSLETDGMDDDALLAELGADSDPGEITKLKHVRSSAVKRTAEEVASRNPCHDFNSFRPLFTKVQEEIKTGVRGVKRFRDDAAIDVDQFFILGGQKAYVEKKGKEFKNAQGRADARLRVIFENGTESDMLMRSLERALQKDEAGRRIDQYSPAPLFANQEAGDDKASGTIYVLRSKADIPFIVENRSLVHKIGVTSGKVEARVARSRLEPTYLMAGVEIVATYSLFNINCGKLEKLIQRVFAPARLQIEIEDRFGNPVVPREWFLVPLDAIDAAVEMIREGTITSYVFDPASASFIATT